MTTKEKVKTEALVRFGATIPADLHRKLKSILVARGESLQSWLIARAKAEVNGNWPGLPDSAGLATRQNAEPGRKEAGIRLPGE